MKINSFNLNTIQNNKGANYHTIAPSFKGSPVVDEFTRTFNMTKQSPSKCELLRDIMVHNKNNPELIKAAKAVQDDNSNAGKIVKGILKALGLSN
jgi:hypothetical protein